MTSALDLKPGDLFYSIQRDGYSTGRIYLALERGSVDLERMALCGIDWRECDNVEIIGRLDAKANKVFGSRP